MKTTKTLLLIGLLALAACGDNLQRPDARKPPDGPPADAQCSNCPAAPALGTQIDRMGRPAINTALNNEFHSNATTAAQAGAAKDAYNANSDPSTWASMMLNGITAEAEFKKNLALLDSIDTNLCGNGSCESGEIGATATCSLGAGNCTACNVASATTPCICPVDCTTTQIGTGPAGVGGGGCGNQVMYNDNGTAGGGNPGVDSYKPLADLLADDELYVDTTKGVCEYYLAVEFGVVATTGNTTCGGRAPEYDVIDYSFSMLAMGLRGFTLQLTPLFHDGADPHTDYTSTFPFLGEPH